MSGNQVLLQEGVLGAHLDLECTWRIRPNQDSQRDLAPFHATLGKLQALADQHLFIFILFLVCPKVWLYKEPLWPLLYDLMKFNEIEPPFVRTPSSFYPR